jgi:WD40 repeat protein
MRMLQSDYPRPLDLLAISAGGHVAFACTSFGLRGDVEVWDLATGTIRHARPGGRHGVRSFAFTPDGRWLLIGADRADLLELETGQVRPGPELELYHPDLALSASGDRLVATTSLNQTGAVESWHVTASPAFTRTWAEGPHEFVWYGSPAVGADGERVAVSAHVGYDRPTETIEIRRATSRKIVREIPLDPADPVQQLAFTADGTKLLARFRGRTVRAFDAETGEPAGELVHKGRPFVTGLAVHPGGKVIATSRTDGTAWFWDPVTFRELRSFDWRLGKLMSVAFGPGGSLAAAGTERGQVVVWDVDV